MTSKWESLRPVWWVSLNRLSSILNNFTHILTHFFTHMYIKNIQTTLLKLLYWTDPKDANFIYHFFFFLRTQIQRMSGVDYEKYKHFPAVFGKYCIVWVVHRWLRLVWYMCLKIKNCYLKSFVEIRVSEKVCKNMWNVV